MNTRKKHDKIWKNLDNADIEIFALSKQIH